jgi:hypothetical protein
MRKIFFFTIVYRLAKEEEKKKRANADTFCGLDMAFCVLPKQKKLFSR